MSDERRAFIQLVATQRRLSWQYRRWAIEDGSCGNLNAYRKHAAEARRLWRAAKWNIEYLRSRTWH